MARFFLFIFAAAVAAVGLASVISAQPQPQVVFGSDDPAEPAARSAAIYAPGRIEGAAKETEIRPQAAGRIVEVSATEGAWVDRGATLFRLDDSEIRQELLLAAAAQAQAEAELQRVENGARVWERDEATALYRVKLAELERAQLALERVENLRQDAVAKQEVDDRRTQVAALTAEAEAAKARAELLSAPPRADELEIARARVNAARAKVALAKVQLDRMTICAPAPGQVLAVEVSPGEFVDPRMTEAPLVMADTRRLRVRAFVEEFDAPNVAVGMTVEVTADGLRERLLGRVSHVSPRMSAKEVWSDRPSERQDSKSREIWIDLEGGTNLVVGLRVDVLIRPTDMIPATPLSSVPVEKPVSPPLARAGG